MRGKLLPLVMSITLLACSSPRRSSEIAGRYGSDAPEAALREGSVGFRIAPEPNPQEGWPGWKWVEDAPDGTTEEFPIFQMARVPIRGSHRNAPNLIAFVIDDGPMRLRILEVGRGGFVEVLPPLLDTAHFDYFGDDAAVKDFDGDGELGLADTLALEDLDGDGELDLIVLASFDTGVGEHGAEPFEVAGAYFRTNGRFLEDPRIHAVLNEGGAWGSLDVLVKNVNWKGLRGRN